MGLVLNCGNQLINTTSQHRMLLGTGSAPAPQTQQPNMNLQAIDNSQDEY